MGNSKKYLEITLLFVIDIISIILTFGIAFLFRKVALPKIYPSQLIPLTPDNISFSVWILLVWIFFFYYEKLYTKRFSFWDEMKALWTVAFLSTIGALVIVSVGKLSHIASRSLIMLTGVASLFILPLVRINSQKLLRNFGIFKRRVIIVGAGDLGRLSLKALRRESNFGYEVIGFIDDDTTAERIIDGIKVHRGIKYLERYIRKCKISDIFLTTPESGGDTIQELINRVQFMVERVLFVPDLQSIPVIGTEIHHFFNEQIFSLEIKNNLKKSYNLFVKRMFDILAGCTLLVIFCLPMIILALVIILESPGSAFFTQQRIGRAGKYFKVFKFRTMYKDAEGRLKELLARDEDAQKDWKTYRKLRNDPRVTRIGSFLRKTSLDELPQLFNVLKGEMSLVGPRPVTQEEISLYYRRMQELCLSVPPGITGLWQVSGRNNTNYNFRVALDTWYVRNWSLWLDIVILLKTVKIVLEGEGAY
ncbi:MAG: undecaprenyl-phosphate galactose phosphotransferase WbaP [Dissulfurispiraceae bacterium]